MKKYFRVFAASVAVVMSMALIAGCSKKPAVTPDQYLTFFLDLAVKNQIGDAKKLGIPDSEVKKLTDEIDKQYESIAASDSSGLDKESSNKLIESAKKGIAKVKYNIKTVESDNKSAKVEMTVYPVVIDEADLTPEKLITQDEIKQLAKEYTDEATLEKKAQDLALDKVCKYFENPKISDEAKTITVELKVEKGEWKEVNEGELGSFIENSLYITK
ncbi:DUF5105 domain-containing protein [Clostridium sp. YIM B02551]|uniref:DUF5105 domain-containing protein n=1 Tax=Clostridium sp. YIM B02551 TaxID=2910679 RepID=UPI001EEBA6CE|nr:DUF5105 domain-containing protein [Clostridium sp. YIM B02551]